MLQLCGGLDLAQEPLATQRGAEIRMKDLDGDFAVMLEIVREIHRRHSARAEFAIDAIPVGEGGAKQFEGGGHCALRWMRGRLGARGTDQPARAPRRHTDSGAPLVSHSS